MGDERHRSPRGSSSRHPGLHAIDRAQAAHTRFVQRLRRSDGVYRWFQNSGFPLRDASGHIVRWCVLLTDIDERKRAEDALARERTQSQAHHRHDSGAGLVGAARWKRRVLQPALSGLHRPFGGTGERLGLDGCRPP